MDGRFPAPGRTQDDMAEEMKMLVQLSTFDKVNKAHSRETRTGAIVSRVLLMCT